MCVCFNAGICVCVCIIILVYVSDLFTAESCFRFYASYYFRMLG